MREISVVVAIYKVEAYLRQCIDSILAQTYKDVEIILVDDGSPDGCPAICDEYAEKDSRIKVIHQKNSGAVSARKNGMLAASGKYISFVDGDDWLEPEMYEEMLAAAKDADFLVTGYIEDDGVTAVQKKNAISSGIYRGRDLEYLYDYALNAGKFYTPGIVPALWNKLIKKDILLKNQCKISERIRMGDDAAVTYSALATSSCVVVANELYLYHYRVVPGSMSRNFDSSYFDGIHDLLFGLKTVFTESGNRLLLVDLEYYKLFLLRVGIDRLLSRNNKEKLSNKAKTLRMISERFDLKKCVECVDLVGMEEEEKKEFTLLAHNRRVLYLCLIYKRKLIQSLRRTIKHEKKQNSRPRIAIYMPDGFTWASSKPYLTFHGYATKFTEMYADYIYARDFVSVRKYKVALKKLGIHSKQRYICSVHRLTKLCDVLVCFQLTGRESRLRDFKGIKIFHTTDYYAHPEKNMKILKQIKVDYLIGHAQLDKRSPFFCRFYSRYNGKVINLPFGYAERFKNFQPFSERKNKAVGLGSINLVKDPMAPTGDFDAWQEYNGIEEFQHPGRYYLLTHKDEFAEYMDVLFPDVKIQKDFSYDAVKMLNSYKMFFNDEGLSNFPPARTFEGIACGCVMVASDNPIYEDIGFSPDKNYIAFEKGNYAHLKEKLQYYIGHPDEIENIQKRSLELAARFSHEMIANSLYNDINRIYGEWK